jgi:hypothetical protein
LYLKLRVFLERKVQLKSVLKGVVFFIYSIVTLQYNVTIRESNSILEEITSLIAYSKKKKLLKGWVAQLLGHKELDVHSLSPGKEKK